MIGIKVPATSANLGSGFDCLGLAVGLYLEVDMELSSSDHFYYTGEGDIADSPNNLIHQGFRAAFQKLAKPAPKVSLYVRNAIPLARGLGSSSSALVAGIALADYVLEGGLGRDGVFQLSAELEGHPDNVAPAVYGHFTVSARRDDGSFLSESIPLPADWQLLFAVPDFELLTSESRAVLPESYARSDLIYNSSRVGLWTAAVALDKPELLLLASQDSIHEPYREPLIKGMRQCRRAVEGAGARAFYLSGAGPTLAAITTSDGVSQRCRAAMQAYVGGGCVHQLEAAMGYQITDNLSF